MSWFKNTLAIETEIKYKPQRISSFETPSFLLTSFMRTPLSPAFGVLSNVPISPINPSRKARALFTVRAPTMATPKGMRARSEKLFMERWFAKVKAVQKVSMLNTARIPISRKSSG